ncbi:ATP-binding cassette domain-containing protein, partial [Streptococcus agalactiae]|nr:ATP-binding cassette domain-containing protein [Streptococcus agalactiae]
YDSLLSDFTFVFQDVYLFDDTVKNNIKFGNPDASDEEVIEVAKQAQCHDFIMNLPEGYETVLQEGGSNLSGGERQRISIARAMLKPSRIVILDEATSSVDPENEEQLMSALRNLLQGKTVLVIAHKLETIQGADQILVMDKGKIENIGTHAELLEKSDIYKQFISQRKKAIGWIIE